MAYVTIVTILNVGSMMMIEEAAVLEWINDVRARIGGEPINHIQKGWAHEPEYCPLTRSLTIGTVNYKFRVNTGSTTLIKTMGHVEPITIENPEPVKRFVIACDRGEYPEYIINEPLKPTMSDMLRKHFLPELYKGYYD